MKKQHTQRFLASCGDCGKLEKEFSKRADAQKAVTAHEKKFPKHDVAVFIPGWILDLRRPWLRQEEFHYVQCTSNKIISN